MRNRRAKRRAQAAANTAKPNGSVEAKEICSLLDPVLSLAPAPLIMPQQFRTFSAGCELKRNQGMTSELFLSRVLAMDCVPRRGRVF